MRGYSLDLSKELCHILILKISVAKTGTILFVWLFWTKREIPTGKRIVGQPRITRMEKGATSIRITWSEINVI